MLAGTRMLAQPTETVSFSPPAAAFTAPLTVELAGAAAGQVIRYEVASGANAAAIEVKSSSPLYTGPIAVTSTTLVRAAVFANAQATTGGRTTSGYYLRLAPDVRGFQSRLPVLVLDVLGIGPLEKDEINHASWLFGFAAGEEGGTFSQPASVVSPLEATVRGSSSAQFPKKGYNVRMRDSAGRSRVLGLFDLPAYERWALVAPWSFDASFINNSFMYELSNRIGRWAPRTRLVELFFNTSGDDLSASDYGGIYVATDRIRAEAGRVAIDRLGNGDNGEPAITGGYIFQLDPPGAGDLSWRTTRGVPEQSPSEIVLVEPSADAVTPAQSNYIREYIQKMEDALHADLATGFAQRSYLDYLDRGSWVDHHILNVLSNNPDALHRSAYFTKPRNGRLQAGPLWDFDRALGGFWDDREPASLINTWSGTGGAVDVWRTGWWGVLAQDPDFVQEWVDRWQSLRHSELETSALQRLVDQLAGSIGEEAAGRDVARWPDSVSPYGSYYAQIAHLKNWLAQRAAWIDSQFIAPPVVTRTGNSLVFTPAPGASLSFTIDGSDPRASGGGFSSGAQLQTGPLVVPTGTTIRVRSYDPGARTQFPSSPWSAPAQIPSVAEAVTPGRIVNLSSKAVLLGGDDALIVGFVVEGTAGKRLLVRAAGPSLAAFGEPEPVLDPKLSVASGAGATLAENDNWFDAAEAVGLSTIAQSVGAFPFSTGSADAATVFDAGGGAYTTSITATRGNGAVLAELYELDAQGRVANVSIRGRAAPDSGLTAGFVISGGTNRVLIRAIGPTLREFGVADAVADPTLVVRSATALLATNDSWLSGSGGEAIAGISATVGAFPLRSGSQDAAVILTLPAGAYTAEVKSGSGNGTVLLEIYDVP